MTQSLQAARMGALMHLHDAAQELLDASQHLEPGTEDSVEVSKIVAEITLAWKHVRDMNIPLEPFGGP